MRILLNEKETPLKEGSFLYFVIWIFDARVLTFSIRDNIYIARITAVDGL